MNEEKKEIEMSVEFNIKLSKDKDIKELCALLDKWHEEGKLEK